MIFGWCVACAGLEKGNNLCGVSTVFPGFRTREYPHAGSATCGGRYEWGRAIREVRIALKWTSSKEAGGKRLPGRVGFQDLEVAFRVAWVWIIFGVGSEGFIN